MLALLLTLGTAQAAGSYSPIGAMAQYSAALSSFTTIDATDDPTAEELARILVKVARKDRGCAGHLVSLMGKSSSRGQQVRYVGFDVSILSFPTIYAMSVRIKKRKPACREGQHLASLLNRSIRYGSANDCSHKSASQCTGQKLAGHTVQCFPSDFHGVRANMKPKWRLCPCHA